MIGWSSHHNAPPNRDGWIYFRDANPNRKSGADAYWEIAVSDKKRLKDVTSRDFDRDFYFANDPRGTNVFGTNWYGRAFGVSEGQVLFARTVENRSVIYVLRLVEQGGPPNYGWMKIEYVIATNRPFR